ncbi:MAG: hypothetical protein ACRC2T_05230, partial [Thermoguttaceae bacterium]
TDEPDLERAARSVVDENGDILYHENIGVGFGGFWVEAKDLRVDGVFLGSDGKLSTLTGTTRVEQEGVLTFSISRSKATRTILCCRKTTTTDKCPCLFITCARPKKPQVVRLKFRKSLCRLKMYLQEK